MELPHWELFSHEADVGVRGVGATLAQAFEQTALALTAVIADPAGVRPAERVDLHVAAPDVELLLVDWLNALIYEMVTRKVLFGRFQVEITDGELHGQAWGEPVDRPRHDPAVELKGATYTALRVAEQEGNWVAQCVVDV